jgi:hypothetical protein
VTVEYSNFVSIERTPTYCISPGELQRKRFKWLIVVTSHSGNYTKLTQNKVPLDEVASSKSLLCLVLGARRVEGPRLPLLQLLFMSDPPMWQRIPVVTWIGGTFPWDLRIKHLL